MGPRRAALPHPLAGAAHPPTTRQRTPGHGPAAPTREQASSMTSAIVVDNEGRTDPHAEQQAIGGRCAQHEDVRTITTEQTIDGYLFVPPRPRT